MERDYRGRDKTGQWHYGDRVRHPNGAVFVVNYSERGGSPMWHQVNPATLGQSTGLRDRDGKEIYKGDILRIGSTSMLLERNITAEVYWDELGMWATRKNEASCNPIGFAIELGCEVIGNIHDNPELLNHGSE